MARKYLYKVSIGVVEIMGLSSQHTARIVADYYKNKGFKETKYSKYTNSERNKRRLYNRINLRVRK